MKTTICEGCSADVPSGGLLCAKCYINKRTANKAAAEHAILEKIGYVNIQDPKLNAFSQRIWTFVHAKCGTEQTWTFGNLQTRLKKDPTNVPCSFCGAKRRTGAI